MWLNYIKTAMRSLVRQRLHAFINIAGLVIGVSTCILVLMYVRYEKSYDEFHPEAENIYRLDFEGKMGDNQFKTCLSAAIAGPTMKREFPEVSNYTRIRHAGFPVLRYADKVFSEEQWWYADSSIFDIFQILFVAGDPKTALSEQNSVVISERMTQKYFGDENPIGKVINSNHRIDFMVTGVVQELPPNSHWHFDFLGSMASYGASRDTGWANNIFHTYLLLKHGTDPQFLEAKIPNMATKYIGASAGNLFVNTSDQFEKRGDAFRFYFTPLTDIHLSPHIEGDIEIKGDGDTVRIFAFIAIFILLLACINYTNQSTARSMSRAREIGIRKTLGAKRNQLIIQFLAESVFITLISFSIAIVIVAIVAPWFSALTDTPLSFKLTDIYFATLWVIPVGLLAGAYPALLLSSFHPIKVLKANGFSGKGGHWMQNGLVIFQFAVSIVLLIGTLIMQNQVNFLQTKDLGLNPNNLLVIKKANDIGSSLQGFQSAVRDASGSLVVSNSTAVPGNPDGANHSVYGMIDEGTEIKRMLTNFWVDYNYVAAYELKMDQGRFFSNEWGTDTNAVVLNEAAVRTFGLSDPIGKELIAYGGRHSSDRTSLRIIGIVKDYHYDAPQHEILPLVMHLIGDGTARYRPNWGKFITVRVDSSQIMAAVSNIEKSWKQYAEQQALEFDHFDQFYGHLFKSERQAARIVSLFAILAILIAALGLLGLASFTVAKRKKEIGIRKVLGASTANILYLLSRDTFKLILVSILIALPIAHYIMQSWLENFAYRIVVSPVVFIGSALFAMLVGILTVIMQSFHSATANPVKSIRYE